MPYLASINQRKGRLRRRNAVDALCTRAVATVAEIRRPPDAPGDSPEKRSGLGRTHLGERLRAARRERGWTLEDASQRTGVARSTLSKIENGMMSPTFDILQKIVIGLSLDLAELFDSRPHSAPPGRRSITRSGEGSQHPTKTYSLELLATDLIQKQLLPFKARIVARRLEDFDVWGRHEGEEFLLILAGEVTVYTEFYAPARLGPGDSAYFDSRMGHAVISVSKDDAEVLWVSSAPPPSEVRAEGMHGMSGSVIKRTPTL